MENLGVLLVIAAIFAWMVGIRANKLNRDTWTWGIVAWLISPLGVWIVLEICGRKKEVPGVQSIEEADEDQEMPIREGHLLQNEVIDSY